MIAVYMMLFYLLNFEELQNFHSKLAQIFVHTFDLIALIGFILYNLQKT
jgi:hypothetical protein